MSEKHLASGSTDPPKTEGLLRVYSMKACPYAKRVRIVLKQKKIPHEIVNIHLLDKPEWFFEIHPKGQVPAIIDNGKIVIESLDIMDYLDETYPTDEPLYPKDLDAKNRDKELIKLGDEATSKLLKVAFSKTAYSAQEVVEKLSPLLQPLEDELEKRGTAFYGGNRPGMVDYVFWPWAEVLEILPEVLGLQIDPSEAQFPNLRAWGEAMLELPLIEELRLEPGLLAKVIQGKRNGVQNYAELFNE